MHKLRPGSRFDLHMHTSESDGRYSPEEVLLRASRGGLDIVAITDHDLATDLTPGPQQVGDRVIHVVPGAEISGVHEGTEFHLLVYFPQGVPEAFKTFCREQCKERALRYARALASLGFAELTTAPVPDPKALTRFHLAQLLVEHGLVGSTHEAFGKYLGDAHGHVPPMSCSFVDAIRLTRSLGGITSWAHPPRPAVERYIDAFVEAGLQGLEGVRPKLSSEERRFYRTTARRHGLFLTGGSDWHGWREGDLGLFRVHAVEIRDFVDVLLAA